ncbi:hypothetical protein SAMN05443270_1056 [Lacrimispora sphenoides]|uniref:hypothetical protein n=1 Tax=Lacrimispora sphenoides TaxID=29370 RepID=UPI0008D4DEAF|nr:hypothetical protein [Lacrimispora sphenoides]SET70845.1 hypothetical protein SAMN05443270_1056 [Lacrimispora sphenoides]
MNNIEKIKFGDQVFDLVAAGVNLGENGGTIKFQKGRLTFDEIETILKSGGSISQIGLSSETDWKRSDLVYSGILTKQSDQVIRTEKVQTGTDEKTKEPIYENRDIKADVMIATFKTPGLRETVAAQTAEIESLKATVDTLVLSSLEG